MGFAAFSESVFEEVDPLWITTCLFLLWSEGVGRKGVVGGGGGASLGDKSMRVITHNLTRRILR